MSTFMYVCKPSVLESLEGKRAMYVRTPTISVPARRTCANSMSAYLSTAPILVGQSRRFALFLCASRLLISSQWDIYGEFYGEVL